MAKNLYNPNTGQLLKPGEVVYNNQTGEKIVQGTDFVPASAPVVAAPKVVAPAVAQKPVITQTPVAQPTGAPAATPASSSYTIKSGDNLSSIAARYGTSVSALMAANPSIKNANLIYAGASLNIPGVSSPSGTSGAGGSNNSVQSQIDSIKSQIADKQSQFEAMEKTGIKDSGNLSKDASGNYIPSSDYLNTEAATGLTAEDRQAIYNKYGITNLETSAFQPVEKTYSEIYQQALLDAGITAKQAAVDEAQAELDKATTDYNSASGEINKNPWKSEAGRVGSQRRLTESYQPEAARLQAKLTLAKNALDGAKTDAQNVATRTLSELEAGKTLEQQQLSYLQKKAEDEISAQTELKKTKASLELKKYYPEAAVGSSSQDYEINGQTIRYTFDKSGKILNKTVIGTTSAAIKAANSATSGSGEKLTQAEKEQAAVQQMMVQINKVKGSDGYISPSDYKTAKNAWVSQGFSAKDFDDNFSYLANPNDPGTLSAYGLKVSNSSESLFN